jgi:hypothetical protein
MLSGAHNGRISAEEAVARAKQSAIKYVAERFSETGSLQKRPAVEQTVSDLSEKELPSEVHWQHILDKQSPLWWHGSDYPC